MSSWTVHVARTVRGRCPREISRKLSGRLVRPACSAGVRSPPPNRRDECRRTKLSRRLRHAQVRDCRRFKRSIAAVIGRTESSERSRVSSSFHSSPVSRRARVCGMRPCAQRLLTCTLAHEGPNVRCSQGRSYFNSSELARTCDAPRVRAVPAEQLRVHGALRGAPLADERITLRVRFAVRRRRWTPPSSEKTPSI